MAYKNGDIVAFDCSFDYQGPDYEFAKIRCVVGKHGAGFDEICFTQHTISLPETLSWRSFSQRVLVTLKGLQDGETYDTYAKIMPETGANAIFWYGDGLIKTEEGAPGVEFRNLSVRIS